MSSRKRDLLDNVAAIAGIITPILVALIGIGGGLWLKNIEFAQSQRQDLETKIQLYTRLIADQEDAQRNMRKEIFLSTVKSFFRPENNPLDLPSRILNLEFIAQNFHKWLNLKCLFEDIEKSILADKDLSGETKRKLLDRLYFLATSLVNNERLYLEGLGEKFDETVVVADVLAGEAEGGSTYQDRDLFPMNKIKRNFQIRVSRADAFRRSISGIVRVGTVSDGETLETRHFPFTIGPFDFPIENAFQLSYDERFTIVLNRFDESAAEITLVNFSTSTRDKLNFTNALRNILESESTLKRK
jgi:hypothetical protein